MLQDAMTKADSFKREGWTGLLLSILAGMAGYGVHKITNIAMADPLVVSLLMGIVIRTATGENRRLRKGVSLAPRIFIPAGIVFYGAKNLNFAEISLIKANTALVMISIAVVYLLVIILLGRLMKQKEQITYLTATGSAICGASAIAVTAPAVDANADDISISLIAITLISVFNLFILFPFIAVLSNVTLQTYAVLSASVLPFTGFIEVAIRNSPFLAAESLRNGTAAFALSLKASKLAGLLVIIPLFSSLTRKRLYIPWFLWALLASGFVGTMIAGGGSPFYVRTLSPLIVKTYNISWSVAMAAIGLNADVKQLLSNNGAKALIMAFAGFIAALITFFMLSGMRL